MTGLFLSHLCGGESVSISKDFDRVFLSHLCGGEFDCIPSKELYGFLSHLCGGECIVAEREAEAISKPPVWW